MKTIAAGEIDEVKRGEMEFSGGANGSGSHHISGVANGDGGGDGGGTNGGGAVTDESDDDEEVGDKETNEKYKTNWKTSNEKKILSAAISRGEITTSMRPKDVYNMHDGIYHTFCPKNFAANYRRLQRRIGRSKSRAEFDRDAISKDRAHYVVEKTTTKGLLRWDGHDAQKLLHMDLRSEQSPFFIEDTNNPKMGSQQRLELYNSREEYQEFPYSRFSSFVGAKLKKIHGGKLKRKCLKK